MEDAGEETGREGMEIRIVEDESAFEKAGINQDMETAGQKAVVVYKGKLSRMEEKLSTKAGIIGVENDGFWG